IRSSILQSLFWFRLIFWSDNVFRSIQAHIEARILRWRKRAEQRVPCWFQATVKKRVDHGIFWFDNDLPRIPVFQSFQLRLFIPESTQGQAFPAQVTANKHIRQTAVCTFSWKGIDLCYGKESRVNDRQAIVHNLEERRFVYARYLKPIAFIE